MSSKWTTDAVDKLSKEAMDQVRQMIELFAWIVSYDNLNLPFMVFSQTLDKKTEFGCGTAAIVHVKKDAPKFTPQDFRELQQLRREGMKNPISALEILELDEGQEDNLLRFLEYEVLQCLLDAPEFEISTYPYRKDKVLDRPVPIHELPCGPDHRSYQYMLGTMSISEASYEGNIQVMADIKRQLGIKTLRQRKEFSQKRIVYWLGDQLTTSRLRGVYRFCCQDRNSEERFDDGLPVWGLCHGMFTWAKSLHKQHLGDSLGFGFSHAFTLLEQDSLHKTATQGPFHEKFERVMRQVLEAHLRACWCIVGDVSNIEQLRECTASQLREMAAGIVERFGSTIAINQQMDLHPDEIDEVRLEASMIIRDLLYYFTYKRAIRMGDIGLIEAMLPYLLYRFIGGRNSHYATEILETLQGLHREWPQSVS